MAVTKSSPFIIPLDSVEGKKLLQESRYSHLLPYFCKQVNSKYCGPCSAAICLNEILEKRRSLPNFHVNEKISELVQLKDTKKTIREDDIRVVGEARSVFRKENVDKEGITLETFARLINSIGLNGSFYHAGYSQDSTTKTGPTISSVDEFRSIVLENLEKTGAHIVVNYLFAAFYPGVNMGHFSPLGGYHFGEDRFLLLDVWPSNSIGWVKTDKLFNAMIPEDSSSHLPRGFCIINAD
ncbi:uncharacterized protein LOC144633043 [Oculina patagonica]